MAAFEIERIDPQEYTGSHSYAPAFTGNAVPAYQPETKPIKAPERKEAPAPRIRPKVKKNAFLSKLQVITCAAALLLVIGLIISNMHLNEVTTQAAELKSEYNDLQQEERALQNRYNTTLDLKAIESTAKNEYGMVSPDSSQIVYLELSRQDKVEILASKGPFDDLSGKISRLAAAVWEYFK